MMAIHEIHTCELWFDFGLIAQLVGTASAWQRSGFESRLLSPFLPLSLSRCYLSNAKNCKVIHIFSLIRIFWTDSADEIKKKRFFCHKPLTPS